MFSFFKKKTEPAAPDVALVTESPAPEPAPRSWLDRLRGATSTEPEPSLPAAEPTAPTAPAEPAPPPAATERRSWIEKLSGGLRRTGSSIAQVFTGTKIDEALYEDLESALLMADAGVKATAFLLADLKRRVKDTKATEPAAVKALLIDAIADLLAPLEQPLRVGEHVPTVIMEIGRAHV